MAAVICDDALHWLSVGDSRLYLWRNRQLVQLSVDHIYASELDRDAAIGNISCEDAKNHPERSSLTSYLGQDPLALIDQNPRAFPLLDGDRLLLCSDGLYAALEANDLATLIDREAQLAAEDLIALALAKGRPNQDNLTVAILACGFDGMPATLIAPKMPPSKNYWGWLGCAVLSAMAGAAAWYYFYFAPI